MPALAPVRRPVFLGQDLPDAQVEEGACKTGVLLNGIAREVDEVVERRVEDVDPIAIEAEEIKREEGRDSVDLAGFEDTINSSGGGK